MTKEIYPNKYKKAIKEIISNGEVKVNYMLYPGLRIHIIGSPDALIESICDEFDINIEDLKGNKRYRKYVEVRYLVYHLLYYKGIIKVKKNIGHLFNKHHSSIIHGMRQFEAWLEVDSKIQEMYRKIIKKYNLKELGRK